MNTHPITRSWQVRYGLAVGAVALGVLLRQALTAWVGPGLPTYITFYPAVMVAALLGRLGPGLLATGLAALATDYWILEPSGLFSIGSLRDGVGLVLFSCMGVFISIVAHLLHQARRRAAAYDQEQALRETRREKDLIENERKRFNRVLDELPAYLVLLSPDYHVPYANRYFEQRFGQAHGRRCFEYLFHRTAPCEVCETCVPLKTNAPHRWEWTGPDGRLYDIHDFPFSDADGSPLIMEVGLDITDRRQAEAELAQHRLHLEDLVQQRTALLESTNALLRQEIEERKRTEQALHESETQLKRAQEIAHLGSWELDVVNNRLTWSDEVFRIFGLKPQEFVATYAGFLAAVHPDDRAAVDAAYTSSLCEGRDSYEIEHRVVRPATGEIRAVHEKCAHIRAATGPIIRSVGMVHDITERKQAEAALRRARDELELRIQERTAALQQTNEQLRREIEVRRQTEQELTEAHLRYRTVAEFTYDWEYWESPDFRLKYCSPSCERMTGYSAAEFMADSGLLQQIVHPEDASIWQRQREESPGAPEPRVIQFRIRQKDGSVRWLEHAWQPVLGPGGEFLGIRAGNRDITDRKEEEFQTQQLREELAHVTRVTTAGQLAASLAHELNQPLTAIHCNAQTAGKLLAADPPNVAEVREALADITHDSERAGAVIQRLRALFKKTAHEQSTLDLNEVIQETLDLLRSEFVLKEVTPTVHLEPSLPKVLGNRVELQQVVLNLVANALEAMAEVPPASRRLHISTDQESPTMLRAAFRDFGPGIPTTQLARLFEPFFTTKANGMGMGLAISQSIVEAHSGSLRAVNNPDRGATFLISLPIHSGETS